MKRIRIHVAQGGYLTGAGAIRAAVTGVHRTPTVPLRAGGTVDRVIGVVQGTLPTGLSRRIGQDCGGPVAAAV